jgi:adenylosuccinate lyase
VVLPDSALLAYYVLCRMTRLLDGLEVFPERMLTNLWSSHGLVFSQPVLLGLVQSGLTRDEAYRIVQENAGRAWDEGTSFRELLDADPRVRVPADVLDDAFDLARSVRHAGRGVDVLDTITGLED